MSIPRIATIAGDSEREALVASAMGMSGRLDLLMRCVDRVEAIGAIRGGGLDAVVIVGVPEWLDPELVSEAASAGVRLIGMATGIGDESRLASLGATLVALDASAAEISRKCVELDVEPPRLVSTQPHTPLGRLIGVWGPKGAPGRTTVAWEVASKLAQEEPSTLLIDGDPYGGDVLQLAGIIDELPTIIWAARMAAKDELDAARLALDLRRAGRQGPVVLPGLPRAELWPEISDFGWRQLLAVARASFRFTVCDVGFCLEPDASPHPSSTEGRNRMARTALREADRVIAVCRGDAVGLKNFIWGYEGLRELVDLDDVVVVANRVTRTHEQEIGDLLRRHVGKRPVAYLPESADVTQAMAAGKSVHELRPGSDLCSAVKSVAAALGGSRKSTGLMARLAGKR